MTDENRRRNTQAELERASSAEAEVELLIDAGFWATAVARAYYGMFYYARALLFSRGLEVRRHAGVIRLLSFHFVRTGELSPELVAELSRMQRLREDADYETAMTFDESLARQARQHLVDFGAVVKDRLQADGFPTG